MKAAISTSCKLSSEQLKLAQALSLEFSDSTNNLDPDILINKDSKGFHLTSKNLPKTKVYNTLSESLHLNRLKKAHAKTELIIKSLGNFKPSEKLLDCTAGLLGDASTLSTALKVTAIERDSALFFLAHEALKIKSSLANRLTIINTNSLNYIKKNSDSFDYIYLDPMFPIRKKSALGSIELRLLKELVGEDPDADELFKLAMAHANKKVIVKRPKHAPELNNKKPTHILKAKSFRFDVYVLPTKIKE